jgi:hypothetical protein
LIVQCTETHIYTKSNHEHPAAYDQDEEAERRRLGTRLKKVQMCVCTSENGYTGMKEEEA